MQIGIFPGAVFVVSMCVLQQVACADDAMVVRVDDSVRQVRVEKQDAAGAGWVSVASGYRDPAMAGWMKLPLPEIAAGAHLRVQVSDQASPFGGTIRSAQRPSDELSEATPGWGFAGVDATAPDNSRESAAAPADIELADIWALRGDQLYFFNQYRGLQLIDLGDPLQPRWLAQYRYPARGENMFVLEQERVLLIGNGLPWSGVDTELQVIERAGEAFRRIDQLAMGSGQYLDSRRWGNFLYVLTREWVESHDGMRTRYRPRVFLHTIELGGAGELLSRGSIHFDGDGYLDAVLDAQPEGLLIALTEREYWPNARWRSRVMVYAPGSDGLLKPIGTARTSGVVQDKFKMQYKGGILTTISQRVDFQSMQFTRDTLLENFELNADGFQRIGSVPLAPGETVFGTRFQGDTVFVVTFLFVDPLFAIDNSDPRRPFIAGELKIPGWSDYLEWVDGWLFAIGPEEGRLAVSMFDVADPADMRLHDRVYLSANAGSHSEAQYNEQAIAFFPERRLLMLPFTTWSWDNEEPAQALQVISWSADGLELRGRIAHADSPRRGTLLGDHAVSVSGREMIITDIADPDLPATVARLPLAWSPHYLFRVGEWLMQVDNGEPHWSGWFWTWRAPMIANPVPQPQVVMTHLDDANLPLLVQSLEAGQLLGVHYGDERLWILQRVSPQDGAEESNAEAGFTLRLQVYAVAMSGELQLLATATREVEHYPAAEYAVQSLADGALLWYSAAHHRSGYFGYDYIGIGWPGWYYPPSPPQFMVTALDGNGGIDWAHFEERVDRAEICSYSAWHWQEPLLIASAALSSVADDPSTRPYYRTEYRLIGWDLSRPDLPLRLQESRIPGMLNGVRAFAADAVFLYFEHRHAELSVWGWDLANAFELFSQRIEPLDTNSNSWSLFWMPPFHGRMQYFPIGPDDRAANYTLQVWWHNPQANQFQRASAMQIDSWFSRTAVAGDYLLAQTGDGLVLSHGDPVSGAWRMEKHWPVDQGLLWNMQPDRALLAAGEGRLWMPFGLYGIELFAWHPQVEPERSAAAGVTSAGVKLRPLSADKSGWRELAPQDWYLTQRDADDGVGRIRDALWLNVPDYLPDPDPAALDLGDHWRQSPWLGAYRMLEFAPSRLQHSEHGDWHFIDPLLLDVAGLFAYDASLGWIWTSAETYPWMYSFAEGEWLGYMVGSATTASRWFWSPAQAAYRQVD